METRATTQTTRTAHRVRSWVCYAVHRRSVFSDDAVSQRDLDVAACSAAQYYYFDYLLAYVTAVAGPY